MKIEIFQDQDHKGVAWVWHFRAGNGEIVAQGEAHPSKGKAIRAAKGVVRAILKPMGIVVTAPMFTQETKDGVTVLTWD